MTDTFFEIVFEEPPAELQLSTELKCREIMKSNDIKKIKRYCCELLRNQAKCDAVVASALGRLAELEAKIIIQEKIIKKKKFNKITYLIHQFLMNRHIEKVVKDILPHKP